jgi:16S rRNA processing protein RimM
MTKSDLVVIGAIAGAHGVRGDAKVKPFGDPAALTAYGPFLDAEWPSIADPRWLETGPQWLVHRLV